MLFSESLVNFRCSGFIVSMYLDQRLFHHFLIATESRNIEKKLETSEIFNSKTLTPVDKNTGACDVFPRITGALSKTS